MNKIFTKIFTDEKIPFVELRYSNSNSHFKEHFHDTFSIGVNKEGISTYTNGTNVYTLDKNMITIINPKKSHSCNSCSDILNKYYMMYLDINWCFNIQKLINEELKTFEDISIELLEDEINYNKYLDLCEYLFSANNTLDKENELINFFIDFFSLYLQKNVKKIEDDSFVKIINYLENNYASNISLNLLSRKFNLNTFYIIKLFKTQTNLTPHTYLLNIRINKAKQLLKKGLSLVDTALECGFYDQSHFHRNFVKIVATTPKEYKINFVQDIK